MTAIDSHPPSGRAQPSLAPTGRDWALAGVLIVAVITESVLRRDLVYPVVAAIGGTLIVLASVWRRRYPLRVLIFTFAIIIGTDIVAVTRVGRPVVLYTGLIVVIMLIHALFRWGTRNQIIAGIGVLAIAVIESQIVEFKGFANVLLSVFVLIATAELAWLVRSGQEERRRMDRLLERERLARELHDTVAHRVSAITISAQAGKVRARTAGSDVTASFDEIEREAKRAMAEMRVIVGRYRDDPAGDDNLGDDNLGDDNLGDDRVGGDRARGAVSDGNGPLLERQDAAAPRRGDEPTGPRLADISQLATDATHPTVRVDVTLSGVLDNIDPAVENTAYRLAQESITNAFRHAHNATRVEVVVVGEPDALRLTVRDDGDPVTTTAGREGFGLRGMNERAELVGGTFHAGPDPDRGWRVEAELPRTGLRRDRLPGAGLPRAGLPREGARR